MAKYKHEMATRKEKTGEGSQERGSRDFGKVLKGFVFEEILF